MKYKYYANILIFLCLLVFSEFSARTYMRYENDNEASLVVAKLNAEIQKIFTNSLVVTSTLRALVRTSKTNAITLNDFNRISESLMRDHAYIDGIILLPDGITTFVYPYVDHQGAIGHNIFDDKQRKLGAKESCIRNNLVLVGPVKLKQNGKNAFIFRRTINNENNTFWGMSVSIVYVSSIITNIENILADLGVKNYTIIGYDPDSENTCAKKIVQHGQLKDGASDNVLQVFNTEWKIKMSIFTYNQYVLRFSFFMLYLLIFLIVYLYIKSHKKHKKSAKEKDILLIEANTDHLTKLPNRRGCEQYIKSFDDTNLNGSIAILDVDFFKKINDTYGHKIGDDVLTSLAQFFNGYTREADLFSRIGGEEFVFLLPYTDIAQAEVICERIRTSLAKHCFQFDTVSINVTISIGLSSFAHSDEIAQALINADAALYEAKHNGRNKVVTN